MPLQLLHVVTGREHDEYRNGQQHRSEFAVRKNRAIIGTLVEIRDGKPSPLEFRDISLLRGDTLIRSFTARRGEFYFDGVEPGEYLLRQDTGVGCSVHIRVPDMTDAMTDIGTAVCQPARR